MTQGRRQKIVTKKHLARVERERILRRNILIATFIVVAAVVGLVGYALIESSVIEPRQVVATVNDQSITTLEFQKRARYQRLQLVQQYINTYQTRQLFGEDPNTAAFFDNNLRQIQVQLEEPTLLGREILNAMIDEILIKSEADRREISVSQAEIDQALQEAFGYFPDGTPTPESFPTSLPTSTLSPTQLALVSPTPTRTPNPEITPTATLSVTQIVDPTPTFEPQPTATEYTLDAYQANFREVLSVYDLEINFKEQDFKQLFEAQLLYQKVFDAITADVEQVQEQVWARHILVPDEETAQSVLDRLDAGEDWSALASELSTDTGNKDRGGDLGWFGSGRMVEPFEMSAFGLAIGEISSPIETQFGWHIIQALGREDRVLSQSEFQQIKQLRFEEWLAEQRDSNEIEILEIWAERAPDDPSIPPQLLDLSQPVIATPSLP